MATKFCHLLALLLMMGSAAAQTSLPTLIVLEPALQGRALHFFVSEPHGDYQDMEFHPKLLGKGGETWPGEVMYASTNHVVIIDDLPRHGLLILADFSEAPFPSWATRLKAQPILEISRRPNSGLEASATGAGAGATAAPVERIESLLGSDSIVVGLPGPAKLYTVLALLASIVWIAKLARTSELVRTGLRYLFTQNDRLSLSRVQAGLFTLAIGSVFFGYGLIMPSVPEIPATLLYLMGLSLVTGGTSFLRSPAQAPAEGEDGSQAQCKPRLSDLITEDAVGGRQLSPARAQMLFWTLLTVVLFVVRSLTDDKLWEVPEQLVILMGLSSAGYLSTKFQPPRSVAFKTPKLEGIVGTPITPQEPTLHGGRNVEFGAQPPVPDGLVIHPTTGVISGTPRTAGLSDHVITATSATGSSSCTLTMEIRIPRSTPAG